MLALRQSLAANDRLAEPGRCSGTSRDGFRAVGSPWSKLGKSAQLLNTDTQSINKAVRGKLEGKCSELSAVTTYCSYVHVAWRWLRCGRCQAGWQSRNVPQIVQGEGWSKFLLWDVLKIKNVVWFCFQTPQLHKVVERSSRSLPTVGVFCKGKGFLSAEVSLKCILKVL